jgi:hypothetical protein
VIVWQTPTTKTNEARQQNQQIELLLACVHDAFTRYRAARCSSECTQFESDLVSSCLAQHVSKASLKPQRASMTFTTLLRFFR